MDKPKIFDLKQRTVNFSLDVISLFEHLFLDASSQILGKQLLRSATSIGANVIEAQAAPSKRDFANFYNIALKSANETKYWLTLLRSSKKANMQSLHDLEKEADELSRILAACLITVRNK